MSDRSINNRAISKVSVAMCTYNGAAHILEQLASLSLQTRCPDELIVVDDQSTDETVSLVRRFAETSPFPVDVFVNRERLGVVGNFERALRLTSGDIIFLSDQDDYWMPKKIEVTLTQFRNERVRVVACDASLVDAERRPMGASLWQSQGLSFRHYDRILKGDSFGVLVERNLFAGMTMAVRRDFLAKALPVPNGWIHDGWIALMAASEDALRMVPEELVEYRQHGKNAIGAQVWSLKQRIDMAWNFPFKLEEQRKRQLEAAAASFNRVISTENMTALNQRIAHMDARCRLPALNRFERVSLIAKELIEQRYAQFSGGVAAAFLDLIRPKPRA